MFEDRFGKISDEACITTIARLPNTYIYIYVLFKCFETYHH